MFGGLLSRIGNIVHNDVIAPVQRGINFEAQYNPVVHGIINAYQSINPNSGVNHAAPFVQRAEQTYHTTPAFNSIIYGGHPSLQTSLGGNGDLTGGFRAAAQTDMSNPINQLQLLPGYGISPAAIIHEALHRQWALNPNDHQNFMQAYSKGLNPALLTYLANRLQGYQGYNPSQLANISGEPQTIQNEIHSYIPEFYQMQPKLALDGPLADYYSHFFAPNFPQINNHGGGVPTDPMQSILNGMKF